MLRHGHVLPIQKVAAPWSEPALFSQTSRLHTGAHSIVSGSLVAGTSCACFPNLAVCFSSLQAAFDLNGSRRPTSLGESLPTALTAHLYKVMSWPWMLRKSTSYPYSVVWASTSARFRKLCRFSSQIAAQAQTGMGCIGRFATCTLPSACARCFGTKSKVVVRRFYLRRASRPARQLCTQTCGCTRL